MILIFPPVAKPCEPPAGIARLCGALDHHGLSYRALDMNLEGLLYLLKTSSAPLDTWTHRALLHLPAHLASLTSWKGYQNEGRYRRAIKDLNRLLEMRGHSNPVRLGLANYEHETLSPTRSVDLIRAAENPEDNPYYPYFKNRFAELFQCDQPSVIGFSLNYLSQALTTFAMIGFLRREYPRTTFILGGGLVTSWMKNPRWQNPFQGLVDHLVAGPGETSLLSILGEKDPKLHLPGMVENHCYQPNYGAFTARNYFSPGPILPYSTSTGCYWNRCTFCPERAEGNSYQPLPHDEVTLDLVHLVNKQKPALIHLLDNTLSPSLLETLSRHPPGSPWYGFARITRHLADLDFCAALRRSGCVMLKLGLESGDQSVLDGLEKGIDLEEASSVFKNLKKTGIATYVYLLFGTPQETSVEARKTLDFAVRHHDRIDFLNLAIFNMPIHGPEAKKMGKEPFYQGDLSLYTAFEHPKGWSRQLTRQFLDREFRRHPAIAPILRRDPPVFTSNHAPFFVTGRGA